MTLESKHKNRVAFRLEIVGEKITIPKIELAISVRKFTMSCNNLQLDTTASIFYILNDIIRY